MGKSIDSKIRPLLTLSYLSENTDQDHPAGINEIISFLQSKGIDVERRALYDDFKALRTAGYDVQIKRGRGTYSGYWLGERTFETAELKLLVDCVQSSKFITEKKTMSLIKKIESLDSRHEAKDLQRQVYVTGRVKSMNETVYTNVDSISSAINLSHSITFRYFDYDTRKKKVFRQGGKKYTVSPYALIWDNENYYLLGYDEPAAMMKHFRVDKMDSITMTRRGRTGIEEFEKLDMSRYSVVHFGMYHGEPKRVRMRFSEHLSSPVIDRFGKDVIMIPQGDGTFTVEAEIAVSPVFFSWLFSFGTDAEIVAPPDVRSSASQYLRELLGVYDPE